jgi:hypothetical protein
MEENKKLPKRSYSYVDGASPYCWTPINIEFKLQQLGERVSTIDGHCWITLGETG